MIQLGSLVPSARVEIIDAIIGDLDDCVATPCVGGDALFGAAPASVCLNENIATIDPTFSVTSKVLTADCR